MLCSKCGKSNDAGFRFCQYCGNPLKNNSSDASSKLDDVPSAHVSVPDSVADWLSDDSIETAAVSVPGMPCIASQRDDTEQMLAAQQRSVPGLKPISSILDSLPEDDSDFHSIDLPITDDISSDIPSLDNDLHLSKSSMPKTSDVPSLVPLDAHSIENTQIRVCRNCGDIVSDGHKFCGNCGARYDDSLDFIGTPAAVDSGEFSDNIKSPGRAVERANFISDRFTPSMELEYTAFTLCHLNDDGTDGEYIPLFEGENIIGRNSSSLLNVDRFVSPKHMRLTCSKNKVIVEDFNSLNGVFIRISRDTVDLMNGDIFRIGEELLCYFHGSSVQPLLTSEASDGTALLGGEESDGWGYLRVIMGAYSEGSVYRLDKPTITLGRTNGNILFPRDGFVSGTHAMLRSLDDHAVLTDLNSSNGTFVRIKQPLTVTKTTLLLVGNQLLRIGPAEH